MELIISTVREELTKRGAKTMTQSLVSKVNEGELDALNTYAKLKYIDIVVTEAIKDIQKSAKRQFELGESVSGVSFKETSGGMSINYEESESWVSMTKNLHALMNTPEILALKKDIAEYEANLKKALEMRISAIEKSAISGVPQDSQLVIDGEEIPVVGYKFNESRFVTTFS